MLKSLHLRNFRNYTEQTIEFHPKINVIFGDNAQGKTNLLEAIYLLSMGRSFRTQKLSEIIQEGKEFFYLEAMVQQESITQNLKLYFDRNGARIECDGEPIRSLNYLLGWMPSVYSLPKDMELIGGSPSTRRRFFDMHLCQHDPLYVHHLMRYTKSLKHKNSLLRKKITDTLEVWETQMQGSGGYLIEKRKELIEQINTLLLPHSQEEIIELDYTPSVTLENYQEQITKYRRKELMQGCTLVGPHRDDFRFSVGGKAAKLFASEGQKRSSLVALRLSEWARLSTQAMIPPIFAVDDLSMHFDPKRIQNLCTKAKDLSQVFVSSCTAQGWESEPLFLVEKGSITSPR